MPSREKTSVFYKGYKKPLTPRPLLAPFLYKFVPLSVVFRAVFSGFRRFWLSFGRFSAAKEQIKSCPNFFITGIDSPSFYNLYKKQMFSYVRAPLSPWLSLQNGQAFARTCLPEDDDTSNVFICQGSQSEMPGH